VRIYVALIALTLLCLPAHGQTTALNGTWKMDRVKSDLKKGPAPSSRLDKINIDGINMKDTISQNLRGVDATYDMIYTLDGKECQNTVRGNRVTATAHWAGQELIIESKVHTFREENITDTYTVSGDGKTMTLRRHMVGPQDADQTLLFDRQ
jgi:hypothetical protein